MPKTKMEKIAKVYGVLYMRNIANWSQPHQKKFLVGIFPTKMCFRESERLILYIIGKKMLQNDQ